MPEARKQYVAAKRWWRAHRTAAPDAIADDFAALVKLLSSAPLIGKRATGVRVRNARVVTLRRTRYLVYYRVIGSPPIVEVLAFWHTARGSGPPI